VRLLVERDAPVAVMTAAERERRVELLDVGGDVEEGFGAKKVASAWRRTPRTSLRARCISDSLRRGADLKLLVPPSA